MYMYMYLYNYILRSHTCKYELTLLRVRYIPLGEMLSLGNTDAAITSLGGLVTLDGPVASAARRLVYAARMPTNQQRVTAAVSAGVYTATNLLSELLGRSDKSNS